ncbi:MAG: tRNA (guanosine(37)-N1)-methyltransferase TrmD [Candidatus Gracilibacteria bacterium]|nr:tRNA (guanosine(37)-N1)-methyltransferase TrmD [Candidatus Gracilibacteria bacterium]
MKIHIITIFPESFISYFSSSIIGNAIKNKLFEIDFYKLNDFSNLKTKRVDDKSFGMHGQILSPKPLSKAINYIFEKIGRKIKVIYLTPIGDLLTQEKSEKLFCELDNEFIIICGHYEGIDKRIIDKYVDYCISIGEYIISSGELASMVFIDNLVRQIPNVLGNKASLEEESFSKKLNRQKEYPQYTKPRIFEGIEVPEILLSGNHKEIEDWKKNNLT